MQIGYGEIISRSVGVAKKHKWLWIYGLLAGAGGTSFNFSRSISSQDIQNLTSSLPPEFVYLEKIMTTWFSGLVPIQTIPFITAVAIVVIFGLIIGFVLNAWAEASLIYGAKEAAQGSPTNLENTSPAGLNYFKRVIGLKLIAAFLGLAIILGLFIGVGIIVAIAAALKLTIVSVLAGIASFIVFLFLVVTLSGAGLYGSRLIVLKNYTAWKAWKAGFKLTKNYFFKTIWMAITAGLLSLLAGLLLNVIGLVILGIPAVVLVIAKLYLAVVPLVLVFFWFSALVTGALGTFRASVWNLFFTKIWAK